MVAIRDFSEFQIKQRWALTGTVAIAALQIVLLTGVLFLVVNAMLLKPFGAIVPYHQSHRGGLPNPLDREIVYHRLVPH